MRQTIAVSIAALLGVALSAPRAEAQERGRNYFEQSVPSVQNALELKVGTGYAQGFGMLAPGRSVPDALGAGVGISADVDYRIHPLMSLGLEGQYQEFTNSQNSAARSIAANAGVTYHLMPLRRGDPWGRLGTGYRSVWELDPNGVIGRTVVRHGFDLATAKIGYDVRVSDDIALAPVLGADLDVFLWQSAGGANTALSSAQIGTFVYAGLQGRFDLGGAKSTTLAPTNIGAR